MVATTNGVATEFINFSRASNATVVASDGKIKWAPHNLLLASEQFDASSWTKSSVTVTANTVAAPNGATTAEMVSPSSIGNARGVYQSVSVTGGDYTVRVYAKPAGFDWLCIYDPSGSGTGAAWFNVTTGALGTVAAGFTATAPVSVGNGWYLCSVTKTGFAAGTFYGFFGGVPSDNTVAVPGAGNGVYLWGAHAYRSDLGGMVANTSAYPMYNPTTPKNLLGYTESFDNAAWAKTASSVTANTIVAPNGLQTGDTYAADGSSSPHRIEQAASAGYQKFFSFYAKAGTNNFVQVFFGGDAAPWANFNLSSGVVGSTGSNQTAAIADAGNGWYRCSVYTSSLTATSVDIAIVSSATAARNETNTLATNVYVWGAQLSDSASLDTYTRNNFAAPSAAAYYGPRLDYDPSTLAAKGLLVEEQRTNLLTYSNAFDNAAWSKSTCSVTPASGISPDGTNNAYLVTSGGLYPALAQAQSGTGNGTFSYFVKDGTSGQAIIRITGTDVGGAGNTQSVYRFTFSNATLAYVSGGTGTASAQSVGNGWYRISLTVSSTTFTAGVIYPRFNDATAATILVYGAQLEAGSFATSYIPTTSATVTRSADVAQVGTSAFPYSATEGTLVAAYTPAGYTSSDMVVSLNDGGGNNIIEQSRASATTLTFRVRDAGVNQVSAGPNVNSTGVNKVGTTYKVNDFSYVANGGSVGVDTVGTVPTTINQLSLGHRATTSPLNGWLRQVTYIPRKLGDAELQTRTT